MYILIIDIKGTNDSAPISKAIESKKEAIALANTLELSYIATKLRVIKLGDTNRTVLSIKY